MNMGTKRFPANESKRYVALLSIVVSVLLTASVSTKEGSHNGPIVLKEQGSFAVGTPERFRCGAVFQDQTFCYECR